LIGEFADTAALVKKVNKIFHRTPLRDDSSRF
jgi:hypothetical protein